MLQREGETNVGMGMQGSAEESFQSSLGSTDSLPTLGPHLTDLTDFLAKLGGDPYTRGESYL